MSGKVAIITFSGLVAVGVTTATDWLTSSVIDDHAVRTAVLAVVYNFSYLPLFVVKFALLDRYVFGHAGNTPDAVASPVPAGELTRGLS